MSNKEQKGQQGMQQGVQDPMMKGTNIKGQSGQGM